MRSDTECRCIGRPECNSLPVPFVASIIFLFVVFFVFLVVRLFSKGEMGRKETCRIWAERIWIFSFHAQMVLFSVLEESLTSLGPVMRSPLKLHGAGL
jgi:short subunit fatty acids transporter